MTIEEDADGIRIQAGKRLHLLIDRVQAIHIELEDIRNSVFELRDSVEQNDDGVFLVPKDLDHVNLRIGQFHTLMQQFTNTLS